MINNDSAQKPEASHILQLQCSSTPSPQHSSYSHGSAFSSGLKQYVAPQIRFKELKMNGFLMANSPVAPINSGGEADPNEECLGNRHRGIWGDLWSEQ